MKNVKKQTKKVTTKAINIWGVLTLLAEATAVFLVIDTDVNGIIGMLFQVCGLIVGVNLLQKLYTLCSK